MINPSDLATADNEYTSIVPGPVNWKLNWKQEKWTNMTLTVKKQDVLAYVLNEMQNNVN